MAAWSGVSTQTVSRVINNKAEVASATRARVLKAVQQLNYRPNAVARSLVSQRTHTLGILSQPVQDYFQAQVVSGLEEKAREQGYICLISFTSGETDTLLQRVDSLLAQRVDGLALLTPKAPAQYLKRLTIPCITLACPIFNAQAINVDVDNVDGARQAVQHLLQLGHRQVGVITGPPGWKASRDRIEGAQRALQEHGCTLDNSFIETSEAWTLEAGYQAAQSLHARHPEMTALFCHNDWLALGAMRALRERNVRVPEQMSIVGYDDLPICQYTHPMLTSVRQPKMSLGKELAQLLIDSIEREESSVDQALPNTPQEILVPAKLQVRDSVTAPRC